MSRKLLNLLVVLVICLSFSNIAVSAQTEEGEPFIIRPMRIYPPDGSVNIIVPLGESIVFRTGWGACTRGLATAWADENDISLFIDGDSVFSTPEESHLYWSRPQPRDTGSQYPCVNGSDTIWVVIWDYELGVLPEGTYHVSYGELVDHPFHDGGDYDGDGKPDRIDWQQSVDFNIIVMEAGSISGTVTDEDGAVEGIWVDACEESVPDEEWGVPILCNGAATDENGHYEIAGLPPGNFRVAIRWNPFHVDEFYNDVHTYDEADLVGVSHAVVTEDIDFELALAGGISGIVTDENGPAAGVWVDTCEESISEEQWWYADPTLCGWAETDEEGFYQIMGLPPGKYRVAIRFNPFHVDEFYNDVYTYDEAELVDVFAEDITEDINFDLALAGGISGIVIDENGPAAGVWMDTCEESISEEQWWDADPTLCGWAETDEEGFYQIMGLPPGKYRVAIHFDPFHVDEFYNDVHTYDQAELVDVFAEDITEDIDFDLALAGGISGFVADKNGPAAGVWVDTCEESISEEDWGGDPTLCSGAETDEEGFYQIMGLPPGKYRVAARWNPFHVDEFYYDVHTYDEAWLIDVYAEDITEGIDFDLTLAGSISGTVSDEDGPVGGIWVDTCEESVSEEEWGVPLLCNGAFTESNGYYEIGGLPPGNYRVSIRWNQSHLNEFHQDAETYDEAGLVAVNEGDTTEEIDFFLTKAGSISGRVTDLDGALEGIWVDACNPDYSFCMGAETDIDGDYTIYGLPADDYRVHVWGGQGGWIDEFYEESPFEDDALWITVIAGEDIGGIDFTMEFAGSISGVVINQATEELLEGIQVMACIYPDDWYCWGSETNSDGVYIIYGLLEGDYRVSVYPQGNWIEEFYDDVPYWDQATPVPITAGSNVINIDFSLEEGGSISGMVTTDGNPIPTGTMWVDACGYDWEELPFCMGAEVNPDGSYAIFGLPEGDYRVSTNNDLGWVNKFYNDTYDWELAESVHVSPPNDTGSINFTLEMGGSISGMVTTDGNPIPAGTMWVDACGYDWNELPFCMGAEVNPDGDYIIFGLPEGDYRVSTNNDLGWVNEFYNDTYDWELAESVHVSPPDDTGSINFTLEIGGSISGHVSDASGDLANIHVDACDWADTFCMGTETDGNGNYTIMGLPGGVYRISVWGGQGGWIDEFYYETPFHHEAWEVIVTVGEDTGGIDFTMELGGTISGHVSDSTGDVAEIYVTACSWDDTFCTDGVTNEFGDYTIFGLPGGDYRVSVWGWQGGWLDEYYFDTPFFDEALPVNVTDGQDTGGIDFTLELAGTISGVVTKQETGEPIAGMQVLACIDPDDWYCWGDQTDSDGNYTIDGLFEGDYWVSVPPQGNWIEEFYDNVHYWDQATLVPITAGSNVINIDFTMEPGGSISGHVSDSTGDVADIFVTACSWDDSFCTDGTTNGDGDYTIFGLPSGDYRVSVWGWQGEWLDEYYLDTHFYEEALPVSVTVGEDTGGINFTLDLAGSISGEVINQDTLEPVVGILVMACIDPDDWYCWGDQTDGAGNYTIEGLIEGDYRVSVPPEGNWIEEFYDDVHNRDLASLVSVTSGSDVVEIDFTLEEGGSISGNVTDIDTNALIGIWVSACGYDWDVLPYCIGAESNENGDYIIMGLLTGEYRVYIWGQQGYYEKFYDDTIWYELATPVTVTAPGNTPFIDFAMELGGTISGVVTDQVTGQPLEGFEVMACTAPDDTDCRGAQTDSNGNYTIIDLPAGDYRVSVYPQGGYFEEFYYDVPTRDQATLVNITPGLDVYTIDFTLEADEPG